MTEDRVEGHRSRGARAERLPGRYVMTGLPVIGAVDWGTSSFRLWLLAEDGAVLGETQNDKGMSALAPDAFEPTLEAALQALAVPPGLPVVICGMAGAAQGLAHGPLSRFAGIANRHC